MKKLLLAFAILAGGASDLPGQEPQVVFIDSKAWRHIGMIAVTDCDSGGQPQIQVRSDLRNSRRLEAILAHERIHARQMEEYPGGCEALKLRYNSDMPFRYALEAEAYCVQARLESDLLSDHNLVEKVIGLLEEFYVTLHEPQETLSSIVSSACRKNLAALGPS